MAMTFTSKSAEPPMGLSATDLNQRNIELCHVIPCSRSDETYTLTLLGPDICSNADALAGSCQLTCTSQSHSRFRGGIANSARMTALRITSQRSRDLTADPHVSKSFLLIYYIKWTEKSRQSKCPLKLKSNSQFGCQHVYKMSCFPSCDITHAFGSQGKTN